MNVNVIEDKLNISSEEFCMIRIILLTLISYSLISVVIYLISGENEEIAAMFGLGIIGVVLLAISKLTYKIKNMFKYHIGKRSIFTEKSTGNKYKCKTKDSDDIYYWLSDFKLVKRYAVKSEWVDIPDFSEEFIENSKKNCDHCKYINECSRTKIKCKHDEIGNIVEFDKFESEVHIW